MKLRETGILGVVILESPIYRDDRGYFLEGYNEQQFLELGLPIDWKQDNLSVSRKNVVRGLHYQLVHPQGKLVRVVSGAAFDVAVDIRRNFADLWEACLGRAQRREWPRNVYPSWICSRLRHAHRGSLL